MVGRVSVSSRGGEQHGFSGVSPPAISADGRWVVFESHAADLVPGDTNGANDVFVHDQLTGATERESVASDGTQANGDSQGLFSISADGRLVLFASYATNLASGVNSGVYIRDRVAQRTELVSVRTDGTPANGGVTTGGSMSPDGRYVAFDSNATNLHPGDPATSTYSYVRDRVTNRTELVSVGSDGSALPGDSGASSVSDDGRYVAFQTTSGTSRHAMVRDRVARTTSVLDVTPTGAIGNAQGLEPALSGNGRFAVFWSYASDLVPGDTNGLPDVFVRDLQNGSTRRVSVDWTGNQVAGPSGGGRTSMSADGRFVIFDSSANNLVPGVSAPGFPGRNQVYVRDLLQDTLVLASTDAFSQPGNDASVFPNISRDGRYVTFASYATNLVADDTNHQVDFFERFVRPPAIITVTPSSVPRGTQHVNVHLVGRNFVFGMPVVVSGPGITIETVNVASETQLDVTLSIAADTNTGRRDIDLLTTQSWSTSPAAVATCPGCLAIT